MIYVTSDLHGRFDCLKKLLNKVNFSDNDWLYIIGDVTDRHGMGGVDILKWLLFQPNVQLILGNHEQLLMNNRWLFQEITRENLDEFNSSHLKLLSAWKENGGDVTINALKKDTAPETRMDILDYLDECPLIETVSVDGRNYVLAHGGLGEFSRDKKLSEYSPEEILWERPTLSTVYDPENYTVIVGHTPTVAYGDKYNNRMIKNDGGWWNIDTGAAMDDGYPMLLCLDDLREFYFDDNETVIERVN
jgi:serine/threonine protein phosphatase 1